MRLIRATREEKRMFEKNFIACDWIKSFFLLHPYMFECYRKIFWHVILCSGRKCCLNLAFFALIWNQRGTSRGERQEKFLFSFFFILCYFINFTMRQKLVSFQLSGIQVRNKLSIEEIIEYKEWVWYCVKLMARGWDVNFIWSSSFLT